jgi:hypothetical protein
VTRTIVPVPCPECGEKQNRTPGDFDPDREPFDPVHCMVCGHQFTAGEYKGALHRALGELEARRRLKPGASH